MSTTTEKLISFAWAVNTLVKTAAGRAVFANRCSDYFDLRLADPDRPPPLPFDRSDVEYIDVDSKPPLELSERYAILAALHDTICSQEPKLVDDSILSDGVKGEPEMPSRREMIWAALLHHTKELNDQSANNVECCLFEVTVDFNTELKKADTSARAGLSASQFPFEYGSDLHWFWGWGHRLDELLKADLSPSVHDWMTFRPDRLARNALIRFAIEYPEVIRQVDTHLEYVEGQFEAFQNANDPSTSAALVDGMSVLARVIQVAVFAIAENAGPTSGKSTGSNKSSRATLHQANQLDRLLSVVLRIPAGETHWSEYEASIEELLTAVFHPVLLDRERQDQLHEGRKRIDISYRNTASDGFFRWLTVHGYPAAYIFIEAKNYGRELGNPEIDQLAGRFANGRGKFGLLVCRHFDDKTRFLKRCRDTATDGRGYIIPIDDDDLSRLVKERQLPETALEFSLLSERFKGLIMNHVA